MRSGEYRLVPAGILLAACALFAPAAIAQASPASPQNVLVVNGNRRPVPITNQIDSQGNAAPLAVLEATQPYEDTCTISIVGRSGGSCTFQSIPSGKRLVIEEFDGQATLGLDAMGDLVTPILIRLDTPSKPHFFPATPMGTSARTAYFATHQQTRIYIGSTMAPQCMLGLSGQVNVGTFVCDVSGFLVDVP